MKQILFWCMAITCTMVLTDCKTKDKVTTHNDTSIRISHWNHERVQRTHLDLFDTFDVYQFPDIGKMYLSTAHGDTTSPPGMLKYRFIRHLNGIAKDTVKDTTHMMFHNSDSKNSITSRTEPKNRYQSRQYIIFYLSLVLVVSIVFWIKR